jgi:hypothetical protein
MKKKVFFLALAVIVAALFLTACQESILDDAQEELTESGLFLKSAQEGEEASVLYFDNGESDKFYFPNNMLFSVEDYEAKVVNRLLIVEDYHIFGDNKEAVFRIKNPGDEPIIMAGENGQALYSPHTENVSAFRLPLTKDDVGSQGEENESRFSGLIKAGPYVLAIKKDQVLVYNLESLETYFATPNYSENDCSFTIESQDFKLTFVKLSPVGNVFTLYSPSGQFAGYTLMR